MVKAKGTRVRIPLGKKKKKFLCYWAYEVTTRWGLERYGYIIPIAMVLDTNAIGGVQGSTLYSCEYLSVNGDL